MGRGSGPALTGIIVQGMAVERGGTGFEGDAGIHAQWPPGAVMRAGAVAGPVKPPPKL